MQLQNTCLHIAVYSSDNTRPWCGSTQLTTTFVVTKCDSRRERRPDGTMHCRTCNYLGIRSPLRFCLLIDTKLLDIAHHIDQDHWPTILYGILTCGFFLIYGQWIRLIDFVKVCGSDWLLTGSYVCCQVITVFTARCTLVQSAVSWLSHVVCPSVCLSVCDVDGLWWSIQFAEYA